MKRTELLYQIRMLSSGTIASIIGDNRYKAIEAAQYTWILAAEQIEDKDVKVLKSWMDFIEKYPAR